MRIDRPSLTASLVALARGVASSASTLDGAPVDAFAHDLLPLPFALLHRAIEAGAAALPALAPIWNLASFGLIDHMAVRTAAIDQALRAAISLGATQLVILGAGLDARALRLPELRALTTYEVDHPATQRYKRSRLEAVDNGGDGSASSGPGPRGRRRGNDGGVRFVPVDFQREFFAGALAAAGHDPARKTFWIWEGVTMYLRPAAIRATLEAMAARSSPGSRAAITYLTPDAPMLPALRSLARLALRVIGEPLIGLMPSSELRALLGATGFEVIRDGSLDIWARDFGDTRVRNLHVPSHLVIAERG